MNTQSFNRYSYVLNNPLSMTDPTGRDGCTTPIATDPATFAVSCSASVIGDAACGPLCGEVIGDVVGAIAAGLEAIFGFGGPSFHGSLQPRPSAPRPNSSATSTQIYSYPPKADLTPINPGAPYTFQAYAVTSTFPDIAPELPTIGELIGGATLFARAIPVVAASVTLGSMAGDNSGCIPPAGTQCYDEQSGHSHGGFDPHFHIYTMNQNPATRQCFWNKKRLNDGAVGVRPPNMYSCSVYPTWTPQP